MSEQPSQAASFPGADAADGAVEQIFPPSQTPMDDAASGPQAEDPTDLFEDPATNDTSTGELVVQGGE